MDGYDRSIEQEGRGWYVNFERGRLFARRYHRWNTGYIAVIGNVEILERKGEEGRRERRPHDDRGEAG